MTHVNIQLPQTRGMGQTERRGAWWLQSLLVFLGFSSFIVYSTWAAFQGNHYHYAVGGAQYLSPFYSPEIFGSSPHAIFGPKPEWLPWPSFIAFSPAFLILWMPGGFRFTCYYYRGAYYKAFWADPPACAVGEPKARGKNYRGEQKFPLLIQNIHRYFLYIALIIIALLAHDAWKSMWFEDLSAPGMDKPVHFGIGVGSLIITLNCILLASYTLGCHSLRHLVGGFMDRLSKAPVRKKAYDCVSCLNRRHMMWAWLSLFWVGFTDVYIRLCSMGVWHDWRLL